MCLSIWDPIEEAKRVAMIVGVDPHKHVLSTVALHGSRAAYSADSQAGHPTLVRSPRASSAGVASGGRTVRPAVVLVPRRCGVGTLREDTEIAVPADPRSLAD